MGLTSESSKSSSEAWFSVVNVQQSPSKLELVAAKFGHFCLRLEGFSSIITARRSFPQQEHQQPEHRPRASPASENNCCCSTPSAISITTPRDPIPSLIQPRWQAGSCARRSIVSLVVSPGKAREQTDSGTGHVFGKPTRKESCYDNLHISRNAWDTNLVKVCAACLLLGKRAELTVNPGKPRIPRRQLGS